MERPLYSRVRAILTITEIGAIDCQQHVCAYSARESQMNSIAEPPAPLTDDRLMREERHNSGELPLGDSAAMGIRATSLKCASEGHSGTNGEASPWEAMIRSLVGDPTREDGVLDTPKNSRARKHAARGSNQDTSFHTARIVVLERISASSALVSWRDPTHCNYGFQMWHRATSRKAGKCALSGSEIRRGDSIYQPRTRPPALNAAAMILSEHIEATHNPLIGDLP
jgi:hypothetical protein